MSSVKRSHIIILTLLLSFLILFVYIKYFRILQINKYKQLISKASEINTEINNNLATYYNKLSRIPKIIAIKKKILHEKEIITYIKTHIQNKPEVSSLIKNILLSNNIQIKEFSFSGFEIDKKKYKTHYKVEISGRIKNILSMMENIEYEVDWLLLDSYKITFLENSKVNMSFNLTAYGRIE